MKGTLLSQYTWERLAERQTRLGRHTYLTRRGDRQNKSHSRNDVVSYFSRKEFPRGLSILTMPSLDWSFERSLLHMREGKRMELGLKPRNTHICAVEADEAVYRLSMLGMPGAETLISTRESPLWATCSLSTPLVVRFHRAQVEDLLRSSGPAFDAAWLDWTGPLTPRRMEALSLFWGQRLKRRLVLTFLEGRNPEGLSGPEVQAELLRRLPEHQLVAAYTYSDNVSMRQMVVDRAHCGIVSEKVCRGRGTQQ